MLYSDEIHNLNNDEGNIYEKFSLFKCNFVFFSATINNINFMKDIFMKYI